MKELSPINAITHIATRNQDVKSHSVLFKDGEILIVIQLLPNRQALVFDGVIVRKLNLVDVTVGRITVQQMLHREGLSMSIEKPYYTDIHHDDYRPILALAKNKLEFTGKNIKLFTAIHTKNIVQVDLNKLVKIFPDKTGEQLKDAFGMVTGYNEETKLYSVMIFEKTITLKREDLINDGKRNSKSVYCLSEGSRQLGLELFNKALTDYETTVANVVKPVKTKTTKTKVGKKEVEVETEQTEPIN